MKILKIIVSLSLLFCVACKKETNNDEEIQQIAGHWHAFDFRPDGSTDAELLAKTVIVQSAEVGCDAIEYTFGTNRYFYARNGMAYVDTGSGETREEISCPSKYDDRNGMFNFDGKKLTLNDEDETIVIDAIMEGEYLVTEIDDMVMNEATVSGTLYFKRETDQ